jgi:hypothetical protein
MIPRVVYRTNFRGKVVHWKHKGECIETEATRYRLPRPVIRFPITALVAVPFPVHDVLRCLYNLLVPKLASAFQFMISQTQGSTIGMPHLGTLSIKVERRVERKIRTRDFVAGNRNSRRLTYPGSFIGQIAAEAMILAHAGQST